MIAIKRNIDAAINSGRLNSLYSKYKRCSITFIITICKFLLLAGLSYIILAPLITMLSGSFKSYKDLYNPLVYLFPMDGTINNYMLVVKYMDYFKSLCYTFIYCSVLTIMQCLVCSFVGYGFARFKFPYRNVLFACVIATILVPAQSLMIPMYLEFRYFDILGLVSFFTGGSVNLLKNPLGMLMITLTGNGLRSGLYIFIFRQFFIGLPKEIEEAALIDGMNAFRTFFRVMLPNAMSSIITVIMFSFVWQYNDTYYSGLFMDGSPLLAVKISSLPQVVYQFFENGRDTNYITIATNTGILLVVAPLILLYLFLQKYFMESIERSGIVG
jgi:ABC-type glycerol-3-phosphate transport system permease component